MQLSTSYSHAAFKTMDPHHFRTIKCFWAFWRYMPFCYPVFQPAGFWGAEEETEEIWCRWRYYLKAWHESFQIITSDMPACLPRRIWRQRAGDRRWWPEKKQSWCQCSERSSGVSGELLPARCWVLCRAPVGKMRRLKKITKWAIHKWHQSACRECASLTIKRWRFLNRT